MDSTYILSLLVIIALMLTMWMICLAQRNTGLIDIAWGLGFASIAITCYASVRRQVISNSIADELLLAFVVVWGIRLSLYLFFRNWGKPEDYRYRAMRDKWGSSFGLISLITVFGLQGAIMWVVSLPIQLGIANSSQPVVWLLALGVIVWLLGWLFESIGDWQLARFKLDPDNRHKVCDGGLWRYTRHPNYFGDFLVWWGIYLVALSQSAPWWTILSPLIMSFLLMRVSGVPLLEKAMLQSKPGYAEYLAKTNAFFPGRPQ